MGGAHRRGRAARTKWPGTFGDGTFRIRLTGAAPVGGSMSLLVGEVAALVEACGDASVEGLNGLRTPVRSLFLACQSSCSRGKARLVKVLKGLAEFNDETLGELLERIVLHSFEPVPGDEGESSASPHGRAALKAIEDLKKVAPSRTSPRSTEPPDPWRYTLRRHPQDPMPALGAHRSSARRRERHP